MTKKLNLLEVSVIFILGLLGVWLWVSLSLPRFEHIRLNVDQAKAVDLASAYLQAQGYTNSRDYIASAVFDADDQADRYLQKTMGLAKAKVLLKSINYDLFYWIVRFYKEKQKEEFKVVVSSATGQVIAFSHDIEETAAREIVDKDQARQVAVDFLKSRFGFDESLHIVHGEEEKKYDNRMDYSFSWENKDIDIPWDKSLGGGSTKLVAKVVVSGREILSFYKAQFDIPEAFNRHIDNLKQTGQNLSMVFKVCYLALLTLAIMVLINRKHHHVPRMVKSLYCGLGLALYVFIFVETLNGYQLILFNYSTAQSLTDYILRHLIEALVNPFFMVLIFVIPAISGEALRVENFASAKHRGFLNYVLSSFLNRSLSMQVVLGYFVAVIILGLQAAIFNIGYHYWGVWDELSWLTQASTNVLPAFTAFLVGVHASLSEEIMFRLFAINFFKKYAKSLFLAVIASAVIWGFGHTGYAVFPTWFRGVEVSCLGIVLGIAYLRYGLVTVVVAHYLMDSFLTSLPYLLNPKMSLNYIFSIVVITLPLGVALIAWLKNQSLKERDWAPQLNAQQLFNYGLLKTLAVIKPREEHQQFKEDLLRHGWDPMVVNRLFNDEGNKS